MAGNGTITSANAVLMLSVTGLFNTPQQIQGFAAEDVYDTEDNEVAEVMFGVDGIMSAGLVYNPIRQKITLQADSPSQGFFEQVYIKERAIQDKYFFDGSILLRSTGKLYTMIHGVMSGYRPLPDAKKVLQPRPFTITWQNITPSAA